MPRKVLSGLASLVLVGGCATAPTTSTGVLARMQTETYRCGDTSVRATYVSNGAARSVQLDFGDDNVELADQVSASGARYGSGATQWWTKGDTAQLQRDGEIVSCTAAQ